jgi:hypothetical protein
MGESNYTDYKVPVPFIPETEKDTDEGDKKVILMKLTLDINGAFIDNPTTQVQPVYNQGTIEQYFKWLKSLNSILRGQTITEKFRLALQTLRGTDAALWKREWDAASPQIAEAAGIDPELQELVLRNAVMAQTVHVLKDPRAGFKQKSYMERNLFIGNNSTGGGVRSFLDRIDVLSTYLPLFPPILNVTYQDLTTQEKQLMLFDALPKDYIDHMKKANQVPLEMHLEELRSYALNIEETKVKEVNNSNSTETKDISNNNNHTPSQKRRKMNGNGKFKKGKNNGQGHHASSILDGQAKHICSVCGNIGYVENTCRAKERSMKDAKQFTKDKSQKWNKDKLKNLDPLQLQQQKQHLPVPPRIMIMMKTNLINMIS